MKKHICKVRFNQCGIETGAITARAHTLQADLMADFSVNTNRNNPS